LPAVGKVVRVRGVYAPTFDRATVGIVSEPRNGVLSFRQLEAY
jgi:hypothetical protein